MALSADAKNRLVVAMADPITGAEVAAASDAARVALTGDVSSTAGNVTAIGAGKVTNAMIVPNALDATVIKSVANANVIAGILAVIRVDVADASADTDVIMTHKVRVLRFDYLATGIAGHATLDTVQLKNAATAITDAVAKTATVNKLATAISYDPAQVEIAAAGTLRITAAKNTNVAGTAYITVIRVA